MASIVIRRRCFSLKRRAQQWARYYIYFCKPVFFISGLIASHAFVENAAISTFISYIMETWEYDYLSAAAAVVNIREGLSTIFRLILVHIADNHMGCFKVVAFTTPLYILGLGLLNIVGRIRYLAILLISVGIAGRGPILKSFLAKQLSNSGGENANNVSNIDQVRARTRVWWNAVWFLCAAITVIILSRNDLKYGTIFIVSSTSMGVAYVLFWSGFFYYDRLHEPTQCSLSLVYKVVRVALLKRHLTYPTNAVVTRNPIFRVLRFLDKAAISETSFPDQETQQGKLCTIEEVYRVKKILGLLPMWTTLLVYALVEATGTTFFIAQSDSFEDVEFLGFVVPINAFVMLESLVSLIVPYLFNALIPKLWKENREKRQLVASLRIALGMVCSILCCVTAFKVEVLRLNSNRKKISMSMLTPQFTLLGIMEGLVHDGLNEFFISQVGESTKHFDSPLNDSVLGIGKFLFAIYVLTSKSWFGDTINDDIRLEKYYLTLAKLSCANLFFYVLVAYTYTWKESTSQEMMDMELVNDFTAINSEIADTMMDDMSLRSRSHGRYSDTTANKKLFLRSRSLV